MEKTAAERIFRIQAIAREDEAYRQLLEEYAHRDACFLHTLESLSPEQRAVIEDYLGLVGQMQLRLLELSVAHREGAKKNAFSFSDGEEY